MADHAKGAILTSVISDALEVGAGACLTPTSGRPSTGDSGTPGAGVPGWPTRGQGPGQERLVKVRGFVILGGRGRQLTHRRFA